MEQEVATVGLDLAMNVFQIHAIATDGAVLIKRNVRRTKVIRFFAGLVPCLADMESCASVHHWVRELHAMGPVVRLMPPAYVKPYVKLTLSRKMPPAGMRGNLEKSKLTGEQIAFALRQADVGTPVAEVGRKMGVSATT